MNYNDEFDIREKVITKKVYMVKEKGTWGEKEMNMFYAIRFCEKHPDNPNLQEFKEKLCDAMTDEEKETDHYYRYRISKDTVVGISQMCVETYPCSHDIQLNGKNVKWDVFECYKFFVDNGVKPPKHIASYTSREEFENKIFGCDDDDY